MRTLPATGHGLLIRYYYQPWPVANTGLPCRLKESGY
jgi:hypothetical protein